MQSINSLREYDSVLNEAEAVMFYFSHGSCNVCKVLRPKVEMLVQKEFARMKLFNIEIDKQSEIAAQNNIFAAPTVLVCFQGKEYYRYSRNLSVNILLSDIRRQYNLIFD